MLYILTEAFLKIENRHVYLAIGFMLGGFKAVVPVFCSRCPVREAQQAQNNMSCSHVYKSLFSASLAVGKLFFNGRLNFPYRATNL